LELIPNPTQSKIIQSNMKVEELEIVQAVTPLPYVEDIYDMETEELRKVL